jgi:hypothetical protein
LFALREDNDEARMTNDEGSPNKENDETGSGELDSAFGISSFLRASSFVIRHFFGNLCPSVA